MNSSTKKSILSIPSIIFLGIGVLLACSSRIGIQLPYPNLQLASFLDRLPVPFNTVDFGVFVVPIEVDLVLVFQNYHALQIPYTLLESLIFGSVVLLVSITTLAYISQFQRIQFLGAGIGWIILLTLFNANGLNVGGANANIPLILLLIGTLGPTIYLQFWSTSLSFWKRWLLIAFFTSITIGLLCYLSSISQPSLYLAEQSLILALAMSLVWVAWQGHGLLSGSIILISKANRGLKTKTWIQILCIGIFWLGLLFCLVLQLSGDLNLGFPASYSLWLLFPLGVLGWISTQEKIKQSASLAGSIKEFSGLYILGFGLSLWTTWKISMAANQAAEDLFTHVFLYSQLGFSVFFFIYLLVNFSPLLKEGKAVHLVLYKPFVLPYYHLRLGGTIGMLVLITFFDAIVANQIRSTTSNILGDYYYQTEEPLAASIFYEDSWDQYRHNPKAKYLIAQLLMQLKQPSLAKEHLEESFAEAPQVDNIILLSERLQRENKPLEALYYLENGLKIFPNNPFLSQNLALVYTLLQRKEDALALITDSPSTTAILPSTWLAMQLKLGNIPDLSLYQHRDLVGLINEVAARRKKGEEISQEEWEKLRSLIEKESSPMLIHAGYRNLLANPNLNDPSKEIALLDSLVLQEEFLPFTMQLQETAQLRNLGAGKIAEAIKNLNGLAFRNPGDAAYYLNLTGLIHAQQLDFEKAIRDFNYSKEKGFSAPTTVHLALLSQDSLAVENQTETVQNDLWKQNWLSRFNASLAEKLFQEWKSFPTSLFKQVVAKRLLAQKAHGLDSDQLQSLTAYLKEGNSIPDDLLVFFKEVDWSNPGSLKPFLEFLNVGEVLTANPYLTPLIMSAADQEKDLLARYEILNAASEFNKDPQLWMRKIEAASQLGLVNYANEALLQLREWMPDDTIQPKSATKN
ncbi:MAG: hypothetical protein ACK5BR_04215 [Bacteroidota bacterium]|jgi:tetratricopeptide (TPR) repeat protein|nr:hypothetical protein [Algoriphagus sp.]